MQPRRRFIRRGLLAVMLLIVVSPGPAGAITIQFDYTYDTTGFFTGNQAATDALERAAETFEPFTDFLNAIVPIGDNTWTASFTSPADDESASVYNPSIAADTLIIYAGARDLSDNALGLGGPGGYSVSGAQWFINTVVGRDSTRPETVFKNLEPGEQTAVDFGPWGGSITFDTHESDGDPRNWHFGLDSQPGGSQNDFLSVAIHEVGHVFGFGTSDSFDNLVTSHQFIGTEAINLYGGNAPLHYDDAHWMDGTISPNAGETAMSPSIFNGQRKLFTALDYAALDDLGWQVPSNLLQPPNNIPGDFDQDGDVDAADFNVWQSGFGALSGATVATGDADEDGDVDGMDFLAWQRSFGSTPDPTGSSSGSTAVPEPSALGLIAIVFLLLLGRRVT